VKKGGEGVRLGTQREGPRVVREIINDHQIILITRNVEYRRSPQITVDKIKSMRSMRRRKRKSNMTTKLACLTEVLSSSPSTRDISTTTNLSQNISATMTEAAVPGGGRRCCSESS
jgi:hypothetical protein